MALDPKQSSTVSMTSADSSALQMARSLLLHVGEDPHREGLLKTPERFAKAFAELTSGYKISARDAIGEGIFQAEGAGLVSVRDIEFHSLCEHHMLPFWGQISIGYLPGEKILGLSKLARVVEVFSRRLQVQERLTREIAEAIYDAIQPRAVFVSAQASHMCMVMRGVRKTQSETRTEYGLGLENLPELEKNRLLRSCDK